MKTSDCAALSAHSQLAPTPENLTHLLEVVSEAVIVVHRNSGRLLAAEQQRLHALRLPPAHLDGYALPRSGD